MALNSQLVQFFLNRIGKSEIRTFGSEVTQLFQYLFTEIKDNPIFEKYNDETKIWEETKNNIMVRSWFLPTDFYSAKSFAYSFYKEVSMRKEKGHEVAFNLIKNTKLNESIAEFNNILLEYLSKALEDIIRANPELDVEKSEMYREILFL